MPLERERLSIVSGLVQPSTGQSYLETVPEQSSKRIQIQYPSPSVDGGRYPAKRCVGDSVRVEADVFRDGHDLLRAVVRYRGPGKRKWSESELHRIDAHLDGVRWGGSFDVDRQGAWEYTVVAWTDVFGTWRDELERKVAAGQRDLAGELSEGIVLLREACDAAASKRSRIRPFPSLPSTTSRSGPSWPRRSKGFSRVTERS
jgi:hypothetical protein